MARQEGQQACRHYPEGFQAEQGYEEGTRYHHCHRWCPGIVACNPGKHAAGPEQEKRLRESCREDRCAFGPHHFLRRKRTLRSNRSREDELDLQIPNPHQKDHGLYHPSFPCSVRFPPHAAEYWRSTCSLTYNIYFFLAVVFSTMT